MDLAVATWHASVTVRVKRADGTVSGIRKEAALCGVWPRLGTWTWAPTMPDDATACTACLRLLAERTAEEGAVDWAAPEALWVEGGGR